MWVEEVWRTARMVGSGVPERPRTDRGRGRRETAVDELCRIRSQTRSRGGPRQAGGARWRCVGSVHETRRANPSRIRSRSGARRRRRRRTTSRRVDDSAAGSAAGSSSIDIACEDSTMPEGATVDPQPRQPSVMNSATRIRPTGRPMTSRRFDPLVPGSLRRKNTSALTGDRPRTIPASNARKMEQMSR